jgi:glycosyltransferase involved in cell wall biosynthesis
MPPEPGPALSAGLAARLTTGLVRNSAPGPTNRPLKVLALASHPEEAAASRYRVVQFIGPLADRGITVDFRAFLTPRQFEELYRRRRLARTATGLLASASRRCRDLGAAVAADVILVQREAMLFGPPVFEYILARLLGKPMVLDLDDATYVSYTSPTYGRLAGIVKWFRKTDDLIRWSRVVVCGNRAIADHAALLGAKTVVIPTVVDTERFRPTEGARYPGPPTLGWVGSHSTFRYLESIFPAIQRLARTASFRLLVVGSGRDEIDLPGVEVICRPWRLQGEVADFNEIGVGLYPIVEEAWSAGKSGFKAIQYMALGIPYVVSPVGACAEIGVTGLTHCTASTPDDWHDALARLLSDPAMGRRMGEAGRSHVLAGYTVPSQADKLADALWMAVDGGAKSSPSGDAGNGPHQRTRPVVDSDRGMS